MWHAVDAGNLTPVLLWNSDRLTCQPTMAARAGVSAMPATVPSLDAVKMREVTRAR